MAYRSKLVRRKRFVRRTAVRKIQRAVRSRFRRLTPIMRRRTGATSIINMRRSINIPTSSFGVYGDGSLYYNLRFCINKPISVTYHADMAPASGLYQYYRVLSHTIKMSRPKCSLPGLSSVIVPQVKFGYQVGHPIIVYNSDGTATDSNNQVLNPVARVETPTSWLGAVDNTNSKFKMRGYNQTSYCKWRPVGSYEKRWSSFGAASDPDHAYGTIYLAFEYNHMTDQSGNPSEFPADYHMLEMTLTSKVYLRARI